MLASPPRELQLACRLELRARWGCGARLDEADCNANSKLDNPEGLKLSRGQNRDLRRKLGLGEVWGRLCGWRYVRWLSPLRDRGDRD